MQERIRGIVDSTHDQLVDLLNALGIDPDTSDKRVFAAVALVGGLSATLTSQETRLTALEWTNKR